MAHTIAYAAAALAEVCCVTEPWAESWCTEVGACRDLLKRVVEQTERRVFDGETVPASEKVVSLFEPHTDKIMLIVEPVVVRPLLAGEWQTAKAEIAASLERFRTAAALGRRQRRRGTAGEPSGY